MSQNCHHSQLSVIPKNWKKSNVDFKKKWRIFYTFYEPGKPPKQVAIRGMNRATSLKEKQSITQSLIDSETEALKAGYNPNLKEIVISNDDNENHTFRSALLFALEKKKMEPDTKRVCKGALNKCLAEAKKLHIDDMPIKNTRRRHIINILDNFPDNVYNECRARLQLLFKELVKREIIEFNPVDEFVEKRKTVHKIRETLTRQQRIIVDNYLHKNYYSFWRYLQIFYHSGARNTELLKVKKSHVDLDNQRYKVIIKKGKEYFEAWKIITDEALQYWQELLSTAKTEDYIFSKGLKPGTIKIQSYQITKRWYRLVKNKLNITADFYSNKHLKSTAVAAALGAKKAAELNSHRSEAMVVKIYDTEYQRRENDELKKVKTPFV